MLRKRIPKYYAIATLIILVIILIIVVIFYDTIVKQIQQIQQISVIRPILLFTTPTHVNLTIEGNSTVSKRISLSFSDVVNLLPPRLDVPLSNQSNGTNLSANLSLKYDNSVPTKEYYIYIIADNSEDIFPSGSYEGIIRFYYKDYRSTTENDILNKAISIDLKVVNNNVVNDTKKG